MAHPKRLVVIKYVSRDSGYIYWDVAPGAMEFLEQIEGLMCIGPSLGVVSQCYDIDEVVAEIDAINIPEPFKKVFNEKEDATGIEPGATRAHGSGGGNGAGRIEERNNGYIWRPRWFG